LGSKKIKIIMANNFSKYYQAVRYVESLSKTPKPEKVKGKDNRHYMMQRIAAFMEFLGNPQLGQKYIHITGTSGKGSTACMMQSVLVAAGFKTGLFLSPHTTAKIDRMRINYLFISPEEFSKIVDEIKPAVIKMKKSEFGRPTHFEICLAIAFIYFKRHHCDYVVLEVSCGGKYDATNIIPAPVITLINLVDYDHEHVLGRTLEAIARQKAGIIKPGTTCITVSQNKKAVIDVISKKCQLEGAVFKKTSINKKFDLEMAGGHQQINANLVATACRYFKIPEIIIKKGLKKAKIPCRFEIIQKNPLVIIDGAHNNSKLESTLKTLANLTYDRLFIIIALSEKKKAEILYKNIAGLADFILVTEHKNKFHKSIAAENIKSEIIKYNPAKKILIFNNPGKALRQALRQANKKDIILITGSLYLAGELRKYWVPEEKILNRRKS
jgi:dihydrofolate synthase / folylpolyglutamate synthase